MSPTFEKDHTKNMPTHIGTLTRALFIALALFASACAEDAAEEPNDDNNGEPDGGEDNEVVNPFFPSDLNDAVDALAVALGDQPQAGDARIAVVANRHSNYWTPAQIGTGRAASVIGCYSSFDATSDGMNQSQIDILDRQVEQEFVGISVSAIDAMGIEPAIENAVDNDTNVITFDSDAAPGSARTLYLGTVNYEAGKAAGEKMVELLGSEGGKVATFAGLSTAANAQERMQGILDAFEGTNVEVVGSYFDDIDFEVAKSNVEDALAENPDLDGMVTIYAYNGPIALGVLEDQDKAGDVKLVAFDLDAATLEGLEAGTVHAAIGQRPYWMGYLSVYILYAMDALGVEETLEVLEPWMSGDNRDIFSTGQDIVTPESLEQYREYLTSLGISSS